MPIFFVVVLLKSLYLCVYVKLKEGCGTGPQIL